MPRGKTLVATWFRGSSFAEVADPPERPVPENRGTEPGTPEPRNPGTHVRSSMATMLEDLRYALRQFVRRPGFTAIAVLSLGLAIGGNSLIYGMVDGFVFHPFPLPGSRSARGGRRHAFRSCRRRSTYVETLSPAEYLDIRAGDAASRTSASFDLGNRNITGGDVPERVFTAVLLDDLFPVIGMQPALGRGFTAEELAPNGPPVAIISHRLWQTRFGGDPGILNRAIRISGTPASIVGVMPPGLLLIGTDLWVPWGGDPSRCRATCGSSTSWRVWRPARRSTRRTPSSRRSRDASSNRRRRRSRSTRAGGWSRHRGPPRCSGTCGPPRSSCSPPSGLVLLIACANLDEPVPGAILDAAARAGGAGWRSAPARWRLTRLLLTESLLLALAGAAVGLVVAWIGLKCAGALIPGQFQIARSRGGHQHARPDLEPGAGDRVRRARGPGAGVAGDAHRSARFAEGRCAHRRIARRPPAEKRARRGRAGAVGRAAARRRSPHSELHEHPAGRSRLRRRRRADDALDAAAREVPRATPRARSSISCRSGSRRCPACAPSRRPSQFPPAGTVQHAVQAGARSRPRARRFRRRSSPSPRRRTSRRSRVPCGPAARSPPPTGSTRRR